MKLSSSMLRRSVDPMVDELSPPVVQAASAPSKRFGNMPEVDPAALAPRPDDFPPDAFPYNLVLASWKDDPLDFHVPVLPEMIAGWFYKVSLDGDMRPEQLVMTPEDMAAGFFTITLPAEDRPVSDTYNLQYVCRSQFDDEWNPITPPYFFTIDYLAPGRPFPGELELPEGVAEEGLTSGRLEELGDVLPCEVPSYTDRIHGDTLVGVLTNVGSEVTVELEPYTIPYRQADEPLFLNVSREQLLALGDGLIWAQYRITDLAGNVSVLSAPVDFELFLTGGIDNLEPPLVPLHEDDSVIDEADARTPVDVHIPGHPDIQFADTVVVLWGSRQQPPVVFDGPDSDIDVILEIPVPYGDVLGEWAEADQDADGNATIIVNYVVYRAGREVGRPRDGTPVKVNLSQAGGEDPDPDTPENEALGRPIVRHSQWETGEQENFIPNASIEENHTFIVPWFKRDADGGITTETAFKLGDILVLRYGEQVIDPTRSINGQDMANQTDIEVPLPWAAVAAEGSGTHEIQYVVTRVIDADTTNVSYSPLDTVIADDAGDLPGGGDPLGKASFEHMYVVWSNVNRNGFERIIVPPYVNMQVGDIVRVHVTANYYDPDKAELLDPVPAAEWGGPLDVNPHPVYNYEMHLIADDIDNELSFYWPKELIKWVWPYGQSRIEYTVSRAGGTPVVTAPIGDDQLTDTTGNGPPEDVRSSSRGPTLTDIMQIKSASERQKALNEWGRYHRTTRAQRRARQAKRATALRVMSGDLKAESPIAKKLAQIAARPVPEATSKE